MTVEVGAVAGMIREALPEFASLVDEHIREFGEEPMLYSLASAIFTSLCSMQDEPRRDRLLRRAYALVDTMLADGSDSVQDCFAIEFIEPLAGTNSDRSHATVEAALGPAATRVLTSMRSWRREYEGMSQSIKRLNTQTESPVFDGMGIGDRGLRVIAEPYTWNALDDGNREKLFSELCRDWARISPGKSHVEITGPRSTGFQVLRSKELDRK